MNWHAAAEPLASFLPSESTLKWYACTCCVPVQFTPLYFGTPGAFPRSAPPLGGGYIEPWALNSKPMSSCEDSNDGLNCAFSTGVSSLLLVLVVTVVVVATTTVVNCGCSTQHTFDRLLYASGFSISGNALAHVSAFRSPLRY